ncbi:hypothetical protein SOH16_006428 [Pseudomonas aeruginosa]|uniref:Uncharacterized protein n=1 Tax=Aquipseudomonas alcaligenes TaxID=43263 RepID=A0AA42N473_AQUAC|nr:MULTISPECIES: hypothetical protein [Pseudomonas aeruginosa group]ELY8031538.1 hypothetical protein [Pseudomonas aeruginosa]MDH1057213.1 hypothetical protein [Pseudomonas alcaligenes]RTV62072.1 hypothetical protein DY990_34185 [Pseudomonas aeruginosa]
MNKRILSVDVQVVLPVQMSGRDGWTLERLITLHEDKSNTFRPDYFFTVVSGDVFHCGGGEGI